MHLKRLELNGFKSFAQKSEFVFDVPIIAIVGPNGSGKSNVVEAIRFVLGEQSVKSMRGKTGSDLIFKGSRDLAKMSRASVTIVFDNRDRVFHIQETNNQEISVDFDEIVITREVYADGANTYLINGNEVRMKDVHELIASVNIGSSGHHIISQGEADRYLNAGVKDRRIFIEEALGLKMYQYRIKESERKLQKSLENIRESELLRRELAPHLRFLKRQVEQIEKAKTLRVELQEQYKEYLAREDFLIQKISERIENEHTSLRGGYEKVQSFLDSYVVAPELKSDEEKEIENIQKELGSLDQVLTTLRHEQGRIEGMLDVLDSHRPHHKNSEDELVSFNEIKKTLKEVISKLEMLSFENENLLKTSLHEITDTLKTVIHLPTKNTNVIEPSVQEEIETLREQKQALELEIEKREEEHRIQSERKNSLYQKQVEKDQQQREQERTYYEYKAQKKELDGKQALLQSQDEALRYRIQKREEEIEEAKVLLGISELHYSSEILTNKESINEQNQEQLRRNIERIKIRIEDIGGGSGTEVITEYNETRERDEFLEKEIVDIQSSVNSLELIISELRETLRKEFEQGIGKINKEFHHFFILMFGGGKARLETVQIHQRKKNNENEESFDDDEETEVEYGIDIHVELPRKKVSDLNMLSGGERSLTSIALLFALSQVNPPPFLVLDETDAALDEANSKKYGDMIQSLSQYSQLVIVTHNRETMSRAQTLFGITLNRNDASSVLSLRLEDASKYAK